MDDLDQRIRAHAHRIWIEKGRPDGRSEDHWDMARELVAIEDHQRDATRPNPVATEGDVALHSEPVEPLEAVESLGDLPGRTDQAERPAYPKRRAKSSA